MAAADLSSFTVDVGLLYEDAASALLPILSTLPGWEEV